MITLGYALQENLENFFKKWGDGRQGRISPFSNGQFSQQNRYDIECSHLVEKRSCQDLPGGKQDKSAVQAVFREEKFLTGQLGEFNVSFVTEEERLEERAVIEEALREHGGDLTAVAAYFGYARKTLLKRLHEHGLPVPPPGRPRKPSRRPA